MNDFQPDSLSLAITTPFKDNGEIDYARFQVLLEQYLEAGIESMVVSSGTGMHLYLHPDESKKLLEIAAKTVDGRAQLIAQTSALLTDDVVERTRRAADLGIAAVMVLPPFFEGPTDDQGLYDFYADVSAAGLPVIGYNVPQAVGVGISPALLERLAEISNFATVKDSSGDLAAQASLIRTGIPTLNGADPLVPYALFAGAKGLIWGGANIAPRTCMSLFKAARLEQWDQVREIWQHLEPIMSLLWQGDYVQSVYTAARLTGYDAGQPRRPLRPLEAQRVEGVRTALGELAQVERDGR